MKKFSGGLYDLKDLEKKDSYIFKSNQRNCMKWKLCDDQLFSSINNILKSKCSKAVYFTEDNVCLLLFPQLLHCSFLNLPQK